MTSDDNNIKKPGKKSKNGKKSDIFSDIIRNEMNSDKTSYDDRLPGESINSDEKLINQSKNPEKELSTPKHADSSTEMSDDSSLPTEGYSGDLIPIDEDNNHGKKTRTIIIIAGIVLIGIFFIWFFGGTKRKNMIFLSTEKITSKHLNVQKTQEIIFPRERPIYIYFQAASRLGSKRILIQIYEKTRQPNGKIIRDKIGSFDASVEPDWVKLDTYFQEEFFDHAGQYSIEISDPAGKVLAGRDFRVK